MHHAYADLCFVLCVVLLEHTRRHKPLGKMVIKFASLACMCIMTLLTLTPTPTTGEQTSPPLSPCLTKIGPEPIRTPTAEELEALYTWLSDDGKLPLRLTLTPSGTVVASSSPSPPPAKGPSVLGVVPMARVVSYKSASASSIGSFFKSDAAQKLGLDTRTVLLLHLVYETFVVAEDSPLWPYLSLLPRPAESSSTLFWSGEQLDKLAGTPIPEYHRLDLGDVKAVYADVVAPLLAAFPDVFLPAAFSKRNVAWAWALVWERGEKLRIKSDDGRDMTAVGIVPLFDFVPRNHTGQVHVRTIGDRVRILSSVPVADGDALYRPANLFGNTKLLYKYGFVFENHPNPTVELRVELPKSDPRFVEKSVVFKANRYRATDVISLDIDQDVNPDLLGFFRIAKMRTDLLDAYNDNPALAARIDFFAPADPLTELRVHKAAAKRIAAQLKKFTTSLDDDNAAINDPSFASLPLRSQMALIVVRDEKRVLIHNLDLISSKIPALKEAVDQTEQPTPAHADDL